MLSKLHLKVVNAYCVKIKIKNLLCILNIDMNTLKQLYILIKYKIIKHIIHAHRR